MQARFRANGGIRMKTIYLVGLVLIAGFLLMNTVQASSPPSPVSQAILDQNVSKPINGSSGTRWEEHQKFCAPHRNYDFNTKKWNQVAAIPFKDCVIGFKKYVDARKLVITPSFRMALKQAGV